VLWGLEIGGLTISGWFTFESIDVTCRVRWARPVTAPDPGYRPKVSLHIPAYNGPRDMLIQTIRSVEAIDTSRSSPSPTATSSPVAAASPAGSPSPAVSPFGSPPIPSPSLSPL
jgi:cellulose synthase/poly-beta-1,6-N-acetylglucosamine synthase-like glycosyltransferase